MNESLLVVKMSIMKREQQQLMTVMDANVDSETDHNMPVIVIVHVLLLKFLLERGRRGTSI
jgi:hypothetical protein